MQRPLNLAAVLLFGVLSSAPAIAETRFLIKSGPSWYTGELGKVTTAGPAWGVSMSFQTIKLLDIELAYQGSSNQLRNPKRPQDRELYRNGGTAMAKVFIPPFAVLSPTRESVSAAVISPPLTTMAGSRARRRVVISRWSSRLRSVWILNVGILAIGARATYRALVRWSETILVIYPGYRDPRGNLFDFTASAGLRF